MCVQAFAAADGVHAGAPEDAFRVPEGFRVARFAGDELAHDIYTLAIDARGRVTAAGRGYVKILEDRDGDGRADAARLFSKEPRDGAHGLYWDGADLYFTGDGILGRLRDRDADGRADGPPEVIVQLRRSGEHAPNGIALGPDGWLYVACGNDAGVTPAHAARPQSPVREPDQGAVLRVRPSDRACEVYACGFRNPYALDFDARGALFTVDADGERDRFLPWYAPTRLFEIAQGAHHGWVLPGWVRSWNRPPWFFDSSERLVEIGRGSPTGLVVYRHHAFPERYRGGVFSACWSLGKIYHFPLKPSGDGYESRLEIFLEAAGGFGFAPVALAVGPDGALYAAIGGRGTQGGVYRIEYVGPRRDRSGRAGSGFEDSLSRILRAPQPLSAWSRAAWRKEALRLGPAPFAEALRDATRPLPERLRAVEILTELFEGVDPALAAELVVEDSAPDLAARVLWALGRKPRGPAGERVIAGATHAASAWVERAAWEALASRAELGAVHARADWDDLLPGRPRRVRDAAYRAALRLGPALSGLPEKVLGRGTPAARLALLRLEAMRGDLTDRLFTGVLREFQALKGPDERIEAVRLLQLALGDIHIEPMAPDVQAGYTARRLAAVSPALRLRAAALLQATFPSGARALDLEVARTLAMLRARVEPGFLERLAHFWTQASPVEDDIHYLIALGLMEGPRPPGVTQRTAAALVRLHAKMRRGGFYPSRFWPVRVGEAFEALLSRDPCLGSAVAAHPDSGLSDHALFAALLPEPEKRRAVRRILDRILEGGESWTGEVVRLLPVLGGEEGKELARRAAAEPGLRDAALEVLVEDPEPADRAVFLEAIREGLPAAVESAANALARLPTEKGEGGREEVSSAVRALRRYAKDKRTAGAARALSALLAARFPEARGRIPRNAASPDLARFWDAWFRDHRPALSKAADAQVFEGAEAWRRRLRAIDWEGGDPERGGEIFARRSCARCHTGRGRLGPDLEGVTARLSPEDLFMAVVDPNRDVSPAYFATEIVTRSGRVYLGQIVYDSPEATLLLVDSETTVRLDAGDILSKRRTTRSPMPEGLLSGATEAELRDLYAYLRTLARGAAR